MKCKVCNQNLVIGDYKLESPIGTTEISCRHVFYCTNKNCNNYAGNDLNSPDAKVAESITKKVGE